jgi:hypothetical protein
VTVMSLSASISARSIKRCRIGDAMLLKVNCRGTCALNFETKRNATFSRALNFETKRNATFSRDNGGRLSDDVKPKRRELL